MDIDETRKIITVEPKPFRLPAEYPTRREEPIRTPEKVPVGVPGSYLSLGALRLPSLCSKCGRSLVEENLDFYSLSCPSHGIVYKERS